MDKKFVQKAVILTALAGALFLFAFFLRDIMIPLFSLELSHDVDGARALLTSKGLAGGAAVALIEALQMIVVFIPAEFIQVSAGLSYPFYVALPLCDLGVCMGAAVIYMLVRTFRFSSPSSAEAGEELRSLSDSRSERGTVLLMYLLFITPVIPFGAICYYASRADIRFRRYILTVATGVIPSIVTSNIIGTGVRAFIMNSLPLWLLVLIIVLMMAVLAVLLWLFLDKVYFKGKDGTPDSAMWFAVKKIVTLWRKHRQRLTVDNEKLRGMEAPFVVLCNHVSFYDFYYIYELLKGYKPAFVVNHHVCTAPILRHMYKKAGMIPKKMFYPDTAAIKMMRTLRAGYPVAVFPEGRLSPDGRTSPIVESAAAFYKRLGVPLALARISGAYFTYPKWRKKFYRGDISISVMRVISPEELKAMSAAEIEAAIASAMTYDESVDPPNRYRHKDRARGLENIIYRCPDCGALYTTVTVGCELKCTACGSVHRLGEDYLFDSGSLTIPDLYDRVKAYEKAALGDIRLETAVAVKIFSEMKPRVRKDKGSCTLTRDEFIYKGECGGFTIPTEKLPALAFSCGEEFELYHDGIQYYFYPDGDRRQVARWALTVDLLREEREAHAKEKVAD